MKKKPGVMLYFDRLTFLDRLDDSQRGRLFTAIINYARDGEVPQIEDLALGMAWDILRPVLDLDAERYEAVCEKNRQNALRRWQSADACECMPNTNTDPNQIQTQFQIQNETENKTKKHSHSQKETARDFAEDTLLRLARERKKEWDAARVAER